MSFEWYIVYIFFIITDSFPSCEVELMVRRGTTRKVAPRQPLTVSCPVKHCGESLNVTWCKLLDECEQINYTKNVEIRQTENHVEDEMISILTFRRISIHDDGLYRCYVKGYKYEQISHIINISVSGGLFFFFFIPQCQNMMMSNFKS